MKRNYKLFILFFTITFLSSVSISFGQINYSTQSIYKYLKGIDANPLQSDWFEIDYDDSVWLSGSAPFRYGDGEGGTVLDDMRSSYSTVFLRSDFTVENLDNLGEIRIAVNWDDGFILWINGAEVLSQQAPETVSADALASGLHESGLPETFLFDATQLALVEGINKIAVMTCNISLDGSSDFYFDMSITARANLPEYIDTLGVTFSHESGFYDDTFSLELSSPVEGVEIVYTLDGSNPQNSGSSLIYDPDNRILIDPTSTYFRTSTPAVLVRASTSKVGMNPSKPKSRTFLFIENVKNQSYPGGSWPEQNLSNKDFQYIYYDMHPGIVNSSEYGDQMDEALLDIPSVSVITDNFNLFDPGYGIYVNAMGHGYDWERECSVELIHPDESTGFNVNAGLRIRGGWSRHNNYPKHAFRLFFREEYGNSKLDYPLFGEEGVDEFDKIDLRTAQNYSWANGSSKYNTFIREVFARDAQRDAGHPYTRSRYYHLYLNGMYWGLFQTQERSEARFAESYFGGQKEDYDVVKINSINYDRYVIATDGNLDKWKEIYDYSVAGFEDNEDYFRMEGKDAYGNGFPGGEVYVEIDNLIDYMINVFYSGNFDAPVSAFTGNTRPNNMWAITNRERKSEGFRFYMHDAEHSLMYDAYGPGIGLYENRANIADRNFDRMNVTEFDFFHTQWLHYKLSKNEEYRIRFANRAWQQLKGEGLFTPEKNIARFNKRAEEIDMAIIAESARWGGSRLSNPGTKDDWLAELDRVKNNYFPYRTEIVIDQFKDLGLFPVVSAPNFIDSEARLFDTYVPLTEEEELIFNNPGGPGSIYYTINGSDPRLIGGEISEDAIQISSGESLVINSSMSIKARVFRNNLWSALSEVNFIAAQTDYSHLKITELHYHPRISILGIDTIFDNVYEFIELKNTDTIHGLNLSGLVLDSAVYFEFPENTILPPQQYFVVASKPSYFFERYGMHPSGNYQRSLSNAGERLILRSASGDVIFDLTYEDDLPWPAHSDGTGASLISVEENPEGDPNNYWYWESGTILHGTPFASEADTVVNSAREILEMNVQLYPNPTTDLLMVQSTEDVNQLRIYDIRGALYLEREFMKSTEVSLNSLAIPGGIYLIEISSPLGRETRKVIYNPR